MVSVSQALRLTEGCEAATPIGDISKFLAEQLQAAGALLKAMEPGLRCALRPPGQELSPAERHNVDQALQVHDLLSQRLARLAAFALEAQGALNVKDVERILGLDSLIQAWNGKEASPQPEYEMF